MVNQRALAFVRQSSFLFSLSISPHHLDRVALLRKSPGRDFSRPFPASLPRLLAIACVPEIHLRTVRRGIEESALSLLQKVRRADARPLESGTVSGVPHPPVPITRLRSVYCYEGLVRQMIREIKYKHRTRFLQFFAGMLYPLICTEFPRSIEALVPVPLHLDREWERRFNQAE